MGVALRDSTWGFAIVETVHLIALAVLGGAIFAVDFRLLGVGLREQTVSELPPNSGRTSWEPKGNDSSEAMRCYYSPAFRWKITLISAGIALGFWRQPVLTRESAPTSAKLQGLTSLTLWLGVGLTGRLIGLICLVSLPF